jgi:hypothetical protein
MVKFNSNIALEAEALSEGESVRIHCETCQGTVPTLAITRKEDGTIVWQCFRAICDERGARHQGGGYHKSGAPREKPKHVRYTGDLRELDRLDCEFLEETVGFDAAHVRTAQVRYAEEEDRFMFPIIGPAYQRRGYVKRTWDNFVRTKALTHLEVDEPHLSWYRPWDEGETIIVEDIPSAVRASRYMNAVALCGTACGPEVINEIAQNARRVVWALDEDATNQSVRLWRMHSLLFDASRVLVLNKDLKDMTEEELQEVLWTTTTTKK